MGKVALVIIYNHQYNKNIDVLEHIYKNRFSNIYHLVPFYRGVKENVIAVYDSSYYFQGYVAQGFRSFFSKEYEHYFFIGDDLLLNPIINEMNYKDELRLDSASCFIPRLSSIDERNVYWANNITALFYNKQSPGVEAVNQLPDYNEALKLLKRFDIDNKPLRFHQIWERPVTLLQWLKKCQVEPAFVFRFLKARLINKAYHISYPLVRSYSDIFVVSADAISIFCHYCGSFAATKLFVELAIPTAMVFSAKEIVTEKDISLKGRALWTKEDFPILDKYDSKLQHLLDQFPLGNLYIHPVKLSKWSIQI
jgi:hypothetical protein